MFFFLFLTVICAFGTLASYFKTRTFESTEILGVIFTLVSATVFTYLNTKDKK